MNARAMPLTASYPKTNPLPTISLTRPHRRIMLPPSSGDCWNTTEYQPITIAKEDRMAFTHAWQPLFRPGNADDFFMDAHPPRLVVDVCGYHPVNAWWLSELSRLIYRRDASEGAGRSVHPSRTEFLARVGLIERRFYNGSVAHAALVETVDDGDAAFAVLVFRGTSGRLRNWMTNLDLTPCDWPSGGRVHRGFKTSLMAIWKDIDAGLARVRRPLFFTGHSLGGALAILAASLRPPSAVYTFGAPRTGDAAFAQSMAEVPVYQVMNPGDIVTELPPAGPWPRFVHTGTIVRNCAVRSDRRRLGQAPGFLAGHAPLNYTTQLPTTAAN